MRYKETIRLIKKSLKTPELYSEEEILYMRKSLDSALLNLARKKNIKKQKGFGFSNET